MIIFSNPHKWTLIAQGLFTVWTMKSSQGPIKSMIGCWTRPRNTSVYTKEKMDYRVQGPQNTYFKAYIIH